MRIVSLLPSTTEILFGIGAGDDVVGVTFECDYPVEARSRRIVSTSAMPEGLEGLLGARRCESRPSRLSSGYQEGHRGRPEVKAFVIDASSALK